MKTNEEIADAIEELYRTGRYDAESRKKLIVNTLSKECDEREHTTISYFCKDELYTDFYECDSCSYSNITLSDSYCGGCGRKVDPTKTDKEEEVCNKE